MCECEQSFELNWEWRIVYIDSILFYVCMHVDMLS